MSTAKTADLDAMLELAFKQFHRAIVGTQGTWFGKERDCVNRFVMGHLVPLCRTGRHAVKDPAQIGIEVAVCQPSGYRGRKSAPKDLVIWQNTWGTCWDANLEPVEAPLAVIEWKVRHPKARKQTIDKATEHDRGWLGEFTRENKGRLGFSVYLDWSRNWTVEEFAVARCETGKWVDEWLVWR